MSRLQVPLPPRRISDGLGVGPSTEAIVEVHQAGHGFSQRVVRERKARSAVGPAKNAAVWMGAVGLVEMSQKTRHLLHFSMNDHNFHSQNIRYFRVISGTLQCGTNATSGKQQQPPDLDLFRSLLHQSANVLPHHRQCLGRSSGEMPRDAAQRPLRLLLGEREVTELLAHLQRTKTWIFFRNPQQIKTSVL